MSIQKKNLFKVIASTALVGFFASCAEIAPPDGAGDEFSEGSCQEIWGINSKCDEVQKEDDQNQEPESSASKDAEDETSSDSEDDSSDSKGGNSEEGGNEDDSGSEEGSSEGEEGGDSGDSSSSDTSEPIAGEDTILGKDNASIGTNDMTEVDSETASKLDELVNASKEEQEANGFSPIEGTTITGDQINESKTFFCFDKEGEWRMITFDNLKDSGLPFLWNGHAYGLAEKYTVRFEDACQAIYVQTK